MAIEYTKKTKILTPVFRVSYPHVLKPQRNEDDTADMYSVQMLFDKDADLTEMKKLAKAIKDKAFGVDASGKFKKVFRSGPEEFDFKKNPEYRDKIICSARSKNRPVGVVKLNKSVPKGKKGRFVPITDENEFYAGCYAMASVTCYDYNHPKGGKGVAFGLSNIIKVSDGEPLVTIANPEEDFDDIDVDLFEDLDVDTSALLDDLDDL